MAQVRFTRRSFREDLRRLPKWAQQEALAAAESIAITPEIGLELEPPLDRFRRIRLRNIYRLVYGYDSDSDSDTWWIYLIGKRRPGKERDVYETLKGLLTDQSLRARREFPSTALSSLIASVG